MYDSKDEGLFSIVLKIAGCLFAMFLIVSMSRACSRYDRDMIAIKDGYCYNRDTKIIYIETYTGRYGTGTTYTPYYDYNGYLCTYEVSTGKWVPVDNELEEGAE